MTSLLWFHTGKRRSVQEFLELLTSGPSAPVELTETKKNEGFLGISEPHVYCYLGKPLEVSNSLAIVLSPNETPTAVSVSPFDTGGLVRKCKGMELFERSGKVDYLRAYSWPGDELPVRLQQYPGDARDNLLRYLGPNLPVYAGPHEVWDGPVCNIWRYEGQWQSWTWEGRWPHRLPTNVHALVAWACSSDLFKAIESLAFDPSTPDDVHDWICTLLGRWIPGGVASLVEKMRDRQAPA